MEQTLRGALRELTKEFGKNELAFLALTTKIELPLRDRWGYVLFKKLAGSKYIVSREWKRTDLAIIEDGKPKVLIEIKAIYTFDAAFEGGFYTRAIDYLQKDEDKALKLASADTEIYTVLFATHPLAKIPVELEGIVKFRAGINRALNEQNSADAVAKIARRRIEEKFKGKHIVSKGALPGGSAFGIGVDVMYWMVRKK